MPQSEAEDHRAAPAIRARGDAEITHDALAWGIMAGRICQLLWWDPLHLVIPMNPTNN